MHGEDAARRQAITELLFFASSGDTVRCKRICSTWGIQPKEKGCCDYDKRTPLHLSAAEGAHSVVSWLLHDCGASPNPIDRFNRTPLEEAVRGDHGVVASLLMSMGGKVVNKEGELVELSDSHLNGNVRMFAEFDPDWEADVSSLKLQDKLGEGEFGVVYRAKWFDATVAVKVLKDHDAVALGDFRTELNVLQKVHHPNTVQFFGAVTKRTPYMIITEYMSGRSLADMFQDGEHPPLPRAVQLALDCALGMTYLHNRRPQAVIHRDLKPANLMIGGGQASTLDQRKLIVQQVGVVKIADFGLSKSLKLTKEDSKNLTGDAMPANGDTTMSTSYKLTGETGSYRYMAPEVFRHEPYNLKVDVYAFSMICYQLFEGQAPFWMFHPVQAAREAAINGKRPSWGERNRFGNKVPPKLRQLVEQCWAADPEKRPDFNEVVRRLQEVLDELPGGSTKGGVKAAGGAGGAGSAGASGGGDNSRCCLVQ